MTEINDELRVLISDWWVLFCDDLYKLLKVYSAVLVFVSIFNHLLNFSRRKPFTHTLTHLRKLFNPKRPHSLLVEDLKKLAKI